MKTSGPRKLKIIRTREVPFKLFSSSVVWTSDGWLMGLEIGLENRTESGRNIDALI